MRALILAAGKGTRLGLKKTPKCMAKVNGKPILEHLVNHLNKAGITEIIVNVHKDYDKIFRYFGTRLLYLYEPTLLGENGTEKVLKDWLGETYVVMNGDTLTNLNITELTRGRSCKFVVKGRYAGTKFVDTTQRRDPDWDTSGAYYFDCGTPKKLAKARRFYARNR